MIIYRNYKFTKVQDFLKNVQPKVKDNQIAEEIYEYEEVIGWNIRKL